MCAGRGNPYLVSIHAQNIRARCPGWTIQGDIAPGQIFQDGWKYRVDRRRRLDLSELYTSPRLKRSDNRSQQRAWRISA
jgi:hypothetical protein